MMASWLKRADGVPGTWIEVEEPFDARSVEDETGLEKADGSEGAVVGLELKLDDGEKLLVGDINTQGGLCDDCAVRGKVVAVRRVWKREP